MTDKILEILDELRGTNTRVDQTNLRLDRLERRQTESEVRVTTELVAVQSALHEVVSLLREDRVARRTLDDHEARLRALEARTG